MEAVWELAQHRWVFIVQRPCRAIRSASCLHVFSLSLTVTCRSKIGAVSAAPTRPVKARHRTIAALGVLVRESTCKPSLTARVSYVGLAVRVRTRRVSGMIRNPGNHFLVSRRPALTPPTPSPTAVGEGDGPRTKAKATRFIRIPYETDHRLVLGHVDPLHNTLRGNWGLLISAGGPNRALMRPETAVLLVVALVVALLAAVGRILLALLLVISPARLLALIARVVVLLGLGPLAYAENPQRAEHQRAESLQCTATRGALSHRPGDIVDAFAHSISLSRERPHDCRGVAPTL